MGSHWTGEERVGAQGWYLGSCVGSRGLEAGAVWRRLGPGQGSGAAARRRAGTRPCRAAPSCGHKPWQGRSVPLDLSCPSGLGVPEPLGARCSKHPPAFGPQQPAPEAHEAAGGEGFLGSPPCCSVLVLPTLLIPGLDCPGPETCAGSRKPDSFECENLPRSSQVASIVFTASPSLFPGL